MVAGYGESKSGLFRLPAQGRDRGVASDAERLLRGFVPVPALRGRPRRAGNRRLMQGLSLVG